MASLGVPRTTLKVDNLFEGLIELTDSCFTHGYYSKMIQRERPVGQRARGKRPVGQRARGKRPVGQSPGEL